MTTDFGDIMAGMLSEEAHAHSKFMESNLARWDKCPAAAVLPDLYRVTVADGKYTFVLPATGGLKCLRYGEEWRSLVGDGAVLALVQEVDNLRTTLREFRDAVAEDYVCELNSIRRPLWARVAELLIPLEKDYDK